MSPRRSLALAAALAVAPLPADPSAERMTKSEREDPVTPHEIVALLQRCRFPLDDEKWLQSAIAQVLSDEAFAFEREVNLGEGDIVDFMTGTTAIEVKINGSRRGIHRQCERYCRHVEVTSLVLATNIAMGFPPMINGKPCFVASLGRAWL